MSFLSKFICNLWVPASTDQLLSAETQLLNHGVQNFEISNVPIQFRDYDNCHIRTLIKDKLGPKDNDDIPLVLCHGYGSGIAGWYRNIDSLSTTSKVYAVDWLGFAGSSRPENGPRGLGIQGTEDWFVESLEEWRKEQGLEKFNLCGHSLGGYLSVCYAERFPDRLNALILSSPVGVPDHDRRDPEAMKEWVAQQPLGRRMAFKTAISLWEGGSTPGGVIRKLGPLGGKRLMSGYVEKRFGEDILKEPWGEYLYHNAACTSVSGEAALNELLTVGAWARRPLHARILNLDPALPVDFVYGDVDWMDHRHADRVAAEAARLNPKRHLRVHVLGQAGHHLHMDNPTAFNACVNALVARHRRRPFLGGMFS